jgi:hypothetical protein
MELRHLRYFIAVAEEGSLTNPAELEIGVNENIHGSFQGTGMDATTIEVLAPLVVTISDEIQRFHWLFTGTRCWQATTLEPYSSVEMPYFASPPHPHRLRIATTKMG